jgi:hypothetical protein
VCGSATPGHPHQSGCLHQHTRSRCHLETRTPAQLQHLTRNTCDLQEPMKPPVTALASLLLHEGMSTRSAASCAPTTHTATDTLCCGIAQASAGTSSLDCPPPPTCHLQVHPTRYTAHGVVHIKEGLDLSPDVFIATRLEAVHTLSVSVHWVTHPGHNLHGTSQHALSTSRPPAQP